MLIDDTQPEETRVVIVDGNKVEDVEFESSSRKQIKGNIYTAKVIRIEPTLQAAFIDYGGNKHGDRYQEVCKRKDDRFVQQRREHIRW